jgi:hypothetical protein
MVRSKVTIARWVRLVEAEYLDMPGLTLTMPQVRRLWSLDAESCEAVLQTLLAAKFLRRTGDDVYERVDRMSPPSQGRLLAASAGG